MLLRREKANYYRLAAVVILSVVLVGCTMQPEPTASYQTTPVFTSEVTLTGTTTLPIADRPIHVSEPPVPDASPLQMDNGTYGIVFASGSIRGYSDIYRMTSDGLNIEQLTHTATCDERNVVASPDGRKILFDCSGPRLDGGIYQLNVESSDLVQLTHDGYYDHARAWSPDGEKIAFTSDRDGYMRLYLMNSDGSGQQRVLLPTDTERDVGHVSWSPDGRYLAYEGVQHAVHADKPLSDTIFILDIAALEVIPLTTKDRGNCLSPAWSPDGQWIAMVCAKGPAFGDYGEIYIAHPDGSGWHQVTTKPAGLRPSVSPLDTFWKYVREPCWSPDGREIVYAARVDGPWNLYAIEIEGGSVRRLTNYDDLVNWDLSVCKLP